MAKFAVGEKVTIPGTIMSLREDESGTYYEVKVRATNTTKTISFEEEDITANENSSTDTTEP